MLIQVAPHNSTTHQKKTFPMSIQYPKLSLYFLTTSITFLILLQVQALKLPLPFSISSISASWTHSLLWRRQPAVGFLPLKDLRFANTAMEGNTWFMSSLNDTQEAGETEHLFFPSDASGGRLLCLSGRDKSNGTRNRYTLAPPGALPPGAELLSGLTYVSDTYYDYENLWHGLTAVVPFVAWHGRKDCVRPARWVLYHWGELRTRMSTWVGSLAEAVFGEIDIEKFEGGDDRPSCFESAVVFRHNEGSMSRERKEDVYDMLRCKARAYCNVSVEVADERAVRLTLLLRTGARSFKDDAAVARIFDQECRKVAGCRLKVARPNNLTFCDQVKLMSSTDILASPHGAQMTNMFFMDKNSSVMEFFPKGWLEFAGVGQYVFQWIASWSGMNHRGAWRDPNGEHCPYSDDKCFTFYKDGQVGHDDAYFAKWAADVLNEIRVFKLGDEYMSRQRKQRSGVCACS